MTYLKEHDMKINKAKTKIIPFNFSRNKDFVPTTSLYGEKLDVVYKTKLLGVICTSDCKWNENTKHLVSKVNSKLWFLRRLKTLGASTETLLDIYKLFIRSHLEFCAPLWTGNLSSKNCRDLERVQKVAIKIILGHSVQNMNTFSQRGSPQGPELHTWNQNSERSDSENQLSLTL